jgi:hypothetical protein
LKKQKDLFYFALMAAVHLQWIEFRGFQCELSLQLKEHVHNGRMGGAAFNFSGHVHRSESEMSLVAILVDLKVTGHVLCFLAVSHRLQLAVDLSCTCNCCYCTPSIL